MAFTIKQNYHEQSEWQRLPKLTRKAKHYIFKNDKVRRPTLREKHIANEAKRMLKRLTKALHASMPIITGNPPKMPMYEPGMLTYKNPPLSVRMPWYDVRKQELVISDDSRKRILALMKEISECMRNFGVNAEQLGKTLREFAMAVKPGNTPDGKPSGTVVREPRTYEYMVATEGNGALVSAR